jgi:hypothetical protein
MPEMDFREASAHFGLGRMGITGLQSSQTEATHEAAHTVSELEPPPGRRLTEQLNQHPLGFGAGIW